MRKKKANDLAAAISMHAWNMAKHGEIQKQREEIAQTLQAPEPTPAEVDVDFMELLKGITPRSESEIRANDFAQVIAPRLKDFGFVSRYRGDGLLNGPDARSGEQRDVLSRIETRCQNVGAIVAMVGPRGTGKTTIAAALAAKRLWEDWDKAREIQSYTTSLERRPVPRRISLYRKLSAVVARFKAFYGDFGTIEMAQLESERAHLASVELLIIDELAEVEDDSRHKDRILTDLLDLRYADRRDTILISNQTKADFAASINPSVASRIAEHGCVIRCEWQSFRDFPVSKA